MSADDLIAALQGDGRVDSEGSFTLNREKAREKLRTFQVAEPQKYVLHLIALASLKGATAVHVRVDSDDVVVRFDGRPITAVDLDDLYGSSFAAARTDEQRARQQLAVAIHAALALNPRYVRVTSGVGDAAVSMVARHGAADEIGGAIDGAAEGTEIHVKQRFRPGLVVRFVQQLRGSLAETTWLRERCVYSTLPIFLNGVAIAEGMRLTDAEHMYTHAEGASRGVAGWRDSAEAAVLRLVRHGVWLHDVPAPHLPGGFVAMVRDDLLVTDLSGDKVVQDEHHARCVRVAEELAAAVLGAVVGAEERRVPEALARRIECVWREWSDALRVGTAIGSVMARVVRWTDVFGEQHSLIKLRAVCDGLGHLPVARGEWSERLPRGDGLVIRWDGAEGHAGDRVLVGVFGEKLRHVDAELEARAVTEQNRRRWRAQPMAATLPATDYGMTAPFEVTLAGVTVTGVVGVRRAPRAVAGLRVIVDGCLLCELEIDAPIAGVDAVLAGPLPLRADFSGPERGDLLAACLGGLLTAAQVVALTALERDLVAGGPELRREMVHGVLRAYRRGEALRAMMRALEFPGESQERHRKQLLRSLPLHLVPHDLYARPWLQGLYAFTTAGGQALTLLEVGRLVAGRIPVRWVAANVPEDALITEPVLRVKQREMEALRWLFAGKIAEMDPGDYRQLLAQAKFREQPLVRGVLSGDTVTPTVTVVHAELKILAAFVTAEAPFVSGRRTAVVEVIVYGRRLCEVTIDAPLPGLRFAFVGEGLTSTPAWDGVVRDEQFAAAVQACGRAVVLLVQAAVAMLAVRPAEAWRRGLLAALTATFPTPVWRAAFATLVAEFGRRDAELRYLRLLALTHAASLADLERTLAANCQDARALAYVGGLARHVGLSVPEAGVADALGAALVRVREALGQTGGSSWLEDVGRCTPEVAALRVLVRADGARVSLGQVAAQIEGLALHMVVHREDCEWPHAGRTRKLAVQESVNVLRVLFDEERLRVSDGLDAPGSGGSAEDLLNVMGALRQRMTAPRATAAALRGLLATAVVQAQADSHEAAVWRRGLVLALGATIPAPGLRELLRELHGRHGARAERVYCAVLLRARSRGVDQLAAELAGMSPGQREQLVRGVDANDARAGQLCELLAAIRAALGQVDGATVVDSVGNYTLGVGLLPLFERIDGSAATLAEVAGAAADGAVHVFAGAGEHERPRAYLRSLRVDEATIDVLRGMYGSDVVTTVAPPKIEEEVVPLTQVRPLVWDALGGGSKDVEAPESPEWQTLLQLAREQDEAPAVTRVEDVALPRSEHRALSGPSRVSEPTMASAPEPTPAERLIAAVRGELHALRRGHESLLTGFNLEHVRAVAGLGVTAVQCGHDGVLLDTNHPRISRAIAGHARDRLWVSFLVSQVYTALNVWREDITDADEAAFLGRHVAWLRGALAE